MDNSLRILIPWAPFTWSFPVSQASLFSPCGSTSLFRTRSRGKLPQVMIRKESQEGPHIDFSEFSDLVIWFWNHSINICWHICCLVSEVASSLQYDLNWDHCYFCFTCSCGHCSVVIALWVCHSPWAVLLERWGQLLERWGQLLADSVHPWHRWARSSAEPLQWALLTLHRDWEK